jgi:hypothetical protein
MQKVCQVANTGLQVNRRIYKCVDFAVPLVAKRLLNSIVYWLERAPTRAASSCIAQVLCFVWHKKISGIAEKRQISARFTNGHREEL